MFDTTTRDQAIRARRQRLEQERTNLLEIVGTALHEMRDRYGIETAHIVGSLTAAAHWHSGSDVDVAIGGASAHILDIMKDLETVTGRDVDVIDLDRHPTGDRVAAKGTQVYG